MEPTPERYRSAWLPALAGLAYTLALGAFAYSSYRANEGHIVYALDDAYIHMAIAKNFVTSGTFGITPYEFSSASSSPLWTFLLTGGYLIWNVSEWLPLVLNSLFGLASILVIWWFGVRTGASTPRLAVLLVATALLTPLVPLAFAGMEHSLHLFVVVVLVYFLWQELSRAGRIELRVACGLSLSTAAAVAVRYESLFLVAAALVALAVKRRWTAVLLCTLSALMPIASFGAFLAANGQDFLPNALLLKGNAPDLGSVRGIIKLLGYDAVQRLVLCPHLYALMICLVLLYAWRQRNGLNLGAEEMLIGVVVAATALHLQFARTDWFYRYEAYLVALALIVSFAAAGPMLDLLRSSRLAGLPRSAIVPLGGVLVLLLLPLATRGLQAHRETVQATQNIYQQQYQMGRFLRGFYDGEPVAANDVGAINYLTRIRCLDLQGLGSKDVLAHKRNGTYSTDVIRELAEVREVRIAIVYTEWFTGEYALPPEWAPVGTWTIPRNVVCARSTVTFLATQQSEVAPLQERLRLFAPRLPEGVVWRELSEAGRDAPEA